METPRLPGEVLAHIFRLTVANDVLCFHDKICHYSDRGVVGAYLTVPDLRPIVNETPLALLNVHDLVTKLPLIVRPIKVVWWTIAFGSEGYDEAKQSIQEMLKWVEEHKHKHSIDVFRLTMASYLHGEAQQNYSDALAAIKSLIPGCRVFGKYG